MTSPPNLPKSFRDHEFQAPTVASATEHLAGIFDDAAAGRLANPRGVASFVAGRLAHALSTQQNRG